MFLHRFTLILLALTGLLRAQNGTFKRSLTKADTAYLKKEAIECFGFNPSLKLSYNNLDFEKTDKRREGDQPATLENIELLKKKTEKEPDNVELYTDITSMYGRLNMPDEAREYRKRSFEVISKVLKEHPDSANAWSVLGTIYMSALQVDSALSKYRQALRYDPLNRDANRLIPFVHIMNNHFDSAYAFIIKQINKYPDNYTVHEALPVYYIYKFYDQLNQYNQLAYIDEERLKPENIMTLKLLKDYYDADKNDLRREYLYRVTYQVCYSTLITYRTVNDSLFDAKHIKFSTTLKDLTNLRPQEEFFNKCLQNKEVENKYLSHKILGNIALLLNQPKLAVPHLKKAIELKPVKKSTIGNNAAEDYDNLITAYFILKDTAQYEKVIFEKLRAKPAIDPIVSDYVMAGKICLHKKKYAEAEKWFQEGLELSKTNADIYLGLSLTHFLSGDHTNSLATINEAYKLNDQKWELFILYGIVSLCNNDPVNAFEAFKMGRKLHNSKWIKEELMEKYFDLF